MDSLDRLKAEARGGPPAELAGVPIRIPPAGLWPDAALDALRAGDYEGWAYECLDDDGWDTWRDVDPTIDDCVALLESWSESTGEDVGQVLSLADFLAEHSEEIEADLARHYPRRSLLDLYRGQMSYRGLWVLVQRLPQESWTQTALRDAQEHELAAPAAEQKFGPWALDNYQLAALTDAVRHLAYLLAQVNGNANYPAPEPTPRPGLNRAVRVQSEANVIYLQSLRAGGG